MGLELSLTKVWMTRFDTLLKKAPPLRANEHRSGEQPDIAFAVDMLEK